MGAPWATLVNVDSAPLQRLVDILLGHGHKALRVGILNAEDKLTPMTVGKEVVEQRGAYTANVQRRWGLGQANSYSGLAHG